MTKLKLGDRVVINESGLKMLYGCTHSFKDKILTVEKHVSGQLVVYCSSLSMHFTCIDNYFDLAGIKIEYELVTERLP